MWISITGMPGSSKSLALEFLQKEEFQFLQHLPPTGLPNMASFEGNYLDLRIRTQFLAQRDKNRKDLVTIRTAWDSCHVFIPLQEQMERLTKEEANNLRARFQCYADLLEPPSVVVVMKTDRQSIMNKLKMNDQLITDVEFKILESLYENFTQKIKVPIIELDTSQPQEILQNNLIFGISSIRSSRSDGDTIWRKEFI